MKQSILCVVWICIVAGLMTVNGCAGSSTPATYYLLNVLPEADNLATAASVGKSPAVLVGPITMPVYLDRTQFVTRIGRNKLEMDEFQRWAEPLEDTFYRVLMENLSVLLQSPDIYMFTRYRAAPVDYQLIIDVMRFDGDSEGNISLIAFWRILDGKDAAIITAQKTVVHARASSPETAAIIAAHNTAVDEFSRAIATAIQAVQP